ncbi:pentatricopeptide repeat-containing protein At2g13600-like [Nymphaea colorata]|uniref:Pentatricopeptide repeat-containing protein n=1 Tax=Nymphaea colorata TaxID=210225 RepID=A0A5K1FZT2_9MAGN|nr:pentatricopeptide repeat-containing protein At2g13600-like [Nymphaea colorata]
MLVQQQLSFLLQDCAAIRSDLRRVASLHALIVKLGFEPDVVLSNHLVNSYCKCGDTAAAHNVFDEMPHRNLVSWSALISGYSQCGRPLEAVKLFGGLHSANPRICANEYVYASVLSSCSVLSNQAAGKQVHGLAVKSGSESTVFVANALITMYMKCGLCGDACKVFDLIDGSRNSVSWNSLITGFADNMEGEKGLEMLRRMHLLGFVLDRFTFMAALTICTYLDELQCGKQLHCMAIKHGLDLTSPVGNVIVTMYSGFNAIDEAEEAFCCIVEKDNISWNTIISACSHCSYHDRALTHFSTMLVPDNFTFASALASCADLASIRRGLQIHARIIRTRSGHVDIGVGNALINMYAKCGSIKYAWAVFNAMLDHNVVSWNSMIAGLSCNGYGNEAIEVFERMVSDGFSPDYITFVGLLSACDHVGSVKQGKDLFDSMWRDYGIEPGVEHVACLINLLGRAGTLSEAEAYAKKFDNVILWGSLLSACRLHGDVELGKRAARRVWEICQLSPLSPSSSSPYVLLSNMCAADGMWEGVAEARKIMKERGVKKEVGNSWIEIGGVVERFSVSDFSHSRMDEILTVIASLSWSLKSSEL